MKTALRVLTAISEKRQPDPGDIMDLHTNVGAPPEGVDLDEYACTVIQEAIKRRAAVRVAARGGPDQPRL